MLTLILMGVATALIGLLPTYEAIGVWAPVLLILLRILQGVSAGGEWGGAVLMAVEHAPKTKRGLFGASPQIGVPLGLLLASGIMALMTVIAPGDAFLAWGWRVPFLLSVVLILIGYYVRRRVEESPVFTELAERKEVTKTPIVQLFRKHALLVLIAALVFAGNNAVGYMTTGGYIQNYSTNPDGPIGLDREPVLWAVAGSAVVWLLSTFFAGWISDRIGRRTTYIIGWIMQLVGVFTLFPLVNTGDIGLLFLGSRSSRSASASPTARRRRCTPSCSRHPSASRGCRSRTRSARSSAAPSPRRSRRRSSRRPARRRRSRSTSRA